MGGHGEGRAAALAQHPGAAAEQEHHPDAEGDALEQVQQGEQERPGLRHPGEVGRSGPEEVRQDQGDEAQDDSPAAGRAARRGLAVACGGPVLAGLASAGPRRRGHDGQRQGVPVLLARRGAGQGAQPDDGARGLLAEHLARQVVAQLLDVRQRGPGGPGPPAGRWGHVRDEPPRAAGAVDPLQDDRADPLVAADGGFDGVRVELAAAGQGDPVPDPAAVLQQPVLAEQAEVAGPYHVGAVRRDEADLPAAYFGPEAGERRAEQGDLFRVVQRVGQLG